MFLFGFLFFWCFYGLNESTKSGKSVENVESVENVGSVESTEGIESIEKYWKVLKTIEKNGIIIVLKIKDWRSIWRK